MEETSRRFLDNVTNDEDRVAVQDVLKIVKGLDFFNKDYKVSPANKGYEIICWLKFSTDEEEVEVNYEQLGLIEEVNRLRIKVMGIKIGRGKDPAYVRIRLVSHTEPCMLSETTLFKAKKRSRWFDPE